MVQNKLQGNSNTELHKPPVALVKLNNKRVCDVVLY